MSIFHKIYEDLQHVCYIWHREMQQVVKDEGVLIFFILVPIFYPLLYSWIYDNETVHEVPVCVVDMSNTALSREFVRKCDASSDVRVAYYAQDLDEGKSLVSRQLVKGIYFIPPDFETNVLRMKQGIVSVYCDMSLMLTYKAIFQTSQLVSMEMGRTYKPSWADTIQPAKRLSRLVRSTLPTCQSSTRREALARSSCLPY